MNTVKPSEVVCEDLPLPIPQQEGCPCEWSTDAIAQLAALPPQELHQHAVKLLDWYVKTDEVNLCDSVNTYWNAGYYMAAAVLSALALKAQVDAST